MKRPSDQTTEGTALATQPALGPSADTVLDPAAGDDGAPALGPYADRGLLGRGGMGEVRRVHDPALGRDVALKRLLPALEGSPALHARFVAEATLTARLEHPGIIPVYERGALDGGAPYYTMRAVDGRTLLDAIRAGVPDEPALRRLIDAFCSVCDAVGYAHAHGVVHRDLKPANIALGAHGEVVVLDWGLACVADRARPSGVVGTPAYMAPEQARGEAGSLAPTVDVYALGAILYHLLVGKPPFTGTSSVVVAAVAGGRVPDPPPVAAPGPPDLVAVCARAMDLDPALRFPHAAAVADECRAWLEGAKAVARAERLVAAATADFERAAARRADAEREEAAARAMWSTLEPWAPIAEKRAGWQLEDAAALARVEAELAEVQGVEHLHAALSHAASLPSARVALADYYQAAHARAERRGDASAARRYETLLRRWDDGRHARWLAGDGTVTLQTDPPGAEVRLSRFEEVDRRLVPRPVGPLGVTPLVDVPLGRGAWLLEIVAPGCDVVRHPITLARNEAWHGGPPGGPAPVLRLPRAGALGPDDVLVPAGPFRCGSADAANALRPDTRWVDAFVIQRFPVRLSEFLRFLNALVADGQEELALRYAPSHRAGVGGARGAMLVARAPDGTFRLGVDDDGDEWQPDWPAMHVTFEAANAYAGWWSAQTGDPWRLPDELEWEKAARGTDGRPYPWGVAMDATWANVRNSRPGPAALAKVTDFPDDASPYGVRGLGGNVKDWTTSKFDRTELAGALVPDASHRVTRGGYWFGGTSLVAPRAWSHEGSQSSDIGFRLVRSWP